MTGPNFTCRVWIAFDPPSSTSPTWVEISGWVQQESPITINHGRSDGLSDVNATTCTLTVDNSDGRFSPANPAGAWYGQVGKSNWLKVEITPPSATVSQRFVGFVTSLPNQWAGQTQFGQITASDRFEKLQHAPAIVSQVQSEVLTDPNIVGFGSMQAYWNLHEPTGSLTFGDTSGQTAQHLVAVGQGCPAGAGFAAANVDGPGLDGTRVPSFVPLGQNQGTYLSGTISSPLNGTWNLTTGAYSGLYGTVEFWFQMPISVPAPDLEPLIGIVDPATAFGYAIIVDNHKLIVAASGTNYANTASYSWLNFLPFPFVVDDGKWHHAIIGVAATNGGGGWASLVGIIDGVWCHTFVSSNPYGGATSGNFTQIVVGGAYNPGSAPGVVQFGQANIAEVSWYWSDLMNQTLANGRPPDALTHYQAGVTGFAGETTDLRIARVARYASVPQPAYTLSTDSFNPVAGFTTGPLGQVQRYSPGTRPWFSLATAAHQVGSQSMAGRKPLDVMLEAAHTEDMPLYMNRSGYLEIQPSTNRQNTSPAWTVAAVDLDPSTQVADDFTYLTNQMTVTPNGAAAQTVVSVPGQTGGPGPTSQAKYDVYDAPLSTASVSPVEAQSLGLGIIQLRADPAPRLAPLAIEASTLALLPGYGSAWYDAVLATEISTPVAVSSAPAALGGGTYNCLVEGWTETITAGSQLIAFNVSAVQGPTYQLDDTVLGRLDTDGTSLQGALTTTATTFTAAVNTATSAAWTVRAADFPFDILMGTERMTVTSIAPVSMGVDGTFETSATGWTLSNCTLVQSTAQAHSGTHSGLMTATANVVVTATTPQFAVYGGATYQPSHWFLVASGAPDNDKVTVSWYTSGGALISTAISPYFLTPKSFWRNQAFSVTAPASAAFATVKIQFTPSATGDAIYIDDAVFTLLTGGQQQFTVTRSVNGVVASHTSGAALALFEPLTLAY